MTTDIAQTILEDKPLTSEQKLAVLRDAREFLSDETNWSRGSYLRVAQEMPSGHVLPMTKEFTYVPSESENMSTCVMGAVARSAGLLGKVDSDEAGVRLMQCSLGRTMLEALPDLRDTAFRTWLSVEKERHLEQSTPEDAKEFTSFLAEREWTVVDYLIDANTKHGGDPSGALGHVYNFNDDRYERDHTDVLALLDTAISNLED